MFGPDGRLYAALHTPRQVVAYDASGSSRCVANDIDADDLAIGSNGHLYVSDWMRSSSGTSRPTVRSRSPTRTSRTPTGSC